MRAQGLRIRGAGCTNFDLSFTLKISTVPRASAKGAGKSVSGTVTFKVVVRYL